MARLTYHDFDLLIERAQDHYRARVIQSPAGQASAEFALPFTPVEVENLVLRVGRIRKGLRGRDSPQMEAAKQFGGKLFEAVFAGNVRGALRSSLDSTAREGAGLRVRLRGNICMTARSTGFLPSQKRRHSSATWNSPAHRARSKLRRLCACWSLSRVRAIMKRWMWSGNGRTYKMRFTT
jgi:hypothetical protein